MDTLDRPAGSLVLDAIATPPEADEFMAQLCLAGAPGDYCPRLLPEAVVDGT